MPLFLVSFHERDSELLGGCVVRAKTQAKAVRIASQFGRQVGLSQHGRVLMTEMSPHMEKRLPERLVRRLLTDEESAELLELASEGATLPPESVVDQLAEELDADIAGTSAPSLYDYVGTADGGNN